MRRGGGGGVVLYCIWGKMGMNYPWISANPYARLPKISQFLFILLCWKETNSIMWLALWVDKMNRALWLATPRGGKVCYLTCCVMQENSVLFPKYKSLTDHACLDFGPVLFCMFVDLNSVSVHKHAKKKEWGQYSAILTKQAWSITGTQVLLA